MIYEPINEENKQQWIDWLTSQQGVLDNKPNDSNRNEINETPDGDIQIAKDLVGNLLALLTNKSVTIN